MLLLNRTSIRLILALVLVLTVELPTVRAASSPSRLNLYISSDIPADSAATLAAAQLKQRAQHPLIQTQIMHMGGDKLPATGLVLASIQQWQHTLPAMTILRLPFFYRDLTVVHSALDGKLGKRLAYIAKANGWKLLAVWDGGMTDFAGNQAYTKLLNLSGMQFALWKPDPLQAMELKALNTWSEVVRKNGVHRNAQQCIVDSRSTTPMQMLREHLQRVLLDVTLTQDRYDGYVLAVPLNVWHELTNAQHARIQKTLSEITRWERKQALHQQQQALAKLHRGGMQVHRLSDAQHRIFMLRMPPWKDFLKQLEPKTVDELLATARTAATTTGRIRAGKKALANPLPGSDAAQQDHGID